MTAEHCHQATCIQQIPVEEQESPTFESDDDTHYMTRATFIPNRLG